MESYKIAIVGPSGVGKSVYIERYSSGKFIRTHNPTPSHEKNTNIVSMKTPNKKKVLLELLDNHYIKVDGIVLMFDNNSNDSFNTIKDYYKKIREENPDIPIVLVGNKVDTINYSNKPDPKNIGHYIHENKLTFYYMSVKSNYNYEKPFASLMKQITNDESFEFA